MLTFLPLSLSIKIASTVAHKSAVARCHLLVLGHTCWKRLPVLCPAGGCAHICPLRICSSMKSAFSVPGNCLHYGEHLGADNNRVLSISLSYAVHLTPSLNML